MLNSRIYEDATMSSTAKNPSWDIFKDCYFSIWANNIFWLPVRKWAFNGTTQIREYDYFAVNVDDCVFYINELDKNGNLLSTNVLTGGTLPSGAGSTFSGFQYGNYTDSFGYTSAVGLMLDFSNCTLPYEYFSFTFVLNGSSPSDTVTYKSEPFTLNACGDEYILIGAKSDQKIANPTRTYYNNMPITDALDRGKFTTLVGSDGTLNITGQTYKQYSFIAIRGKLIDIAPVFNQTFGSDMKNVQFSSELIPTKALEITEPFGVPIWVLNELIAISSASFVIAIKGAVVGSVVEYLHEIFNMTVTADNSFAEGKTVRYVPKIRLTDKPIKTYPHS